MSAYKWLAFAVGIPLLAIMYSIFTEFVTPGVDILNQMSSTQASSQGITWFEQFWEWLPLVLLLLLGFMVLVAVITRRNRVVRR